jgi:hypothetical protein
VFQKAVGLSRVAVEEEEAKKNAERELTGRKRIVGAAEGQIGRGGWKVKGKEER